MPALVMTKARSFNRAPHCAQYSTSILKLRMRSSRHGRYPERWVGGLSLAMQMEHSCLLSSGSADGFGGGTTRALHWLAAATTPAYLTV